MHQSTDRITHTTAFVTPVVKHWLEREITRERKERNVLFNDALNTFYLLLYGVKQMVKNHSESARGNLLPSLPGLHFPISNKGSFICTDKIAYTTDIVTPVLEHWLE